jgi:hypothetical protein
MPTSALGLGQSLTTARREISVRNKLLMLAFSGSARKEYGDGTASSKQHPVFRNRRRVNSVLIETGSMPFALDIFSSP